MIEQPAAPPNLVRNASGEVICRAPRRYQHRYNPAMPCGTTVATNRRADELVVRCKNCKTSHRFRAVEGRIVPVA